VLARVLRYLSRDVTLYCAEAKISATGHRYSISTTTMYPEARLSRRRKLESTRTINLAPNATLRDLPLGCILAPTPIYIAPRWWSKCYLARTRYAVGLHSSRPLIYVAVVQISEGVIFSSQGSPVRERSDISEPFFNPYLTTFLRV
jgi:hypothetical protein